MKLYKKTIRERNIIHPTAIIDDGVIIGEGNYIGPYCIIYDGVEIGDNNRFESNVIIGSNAEHRDYFKKGSNFSVKIANNNIFREFVTLNSGVNYDTSIGNNNIMLRNSHAGHDVIIGNNCTISCNVLLGGFTQVLDGVNCGLGSITHQYSILGNYSMLGMGTIVTKSSKIEPGKIYIGNPAKFLKENIIGLERADISKEQLLKFKQEYESLLK